MKVGNIFLIVGKVRSRVFCEIDVLKFNNIITERYFFNEISGFLNGFFQKLTIQQSMLIVLGMIWEFGESIWRWCDMKFKSDYQANSYLQIN